MPRHIKPGTRFGRWTVLKRDPEDWERQLCECDCGTQRSVGVYRLMNGRSKSCGCLVRERAASKALPKVKEGTVFNNLQLIRYVIQSRTSAHFKCICGGEGVYKVAVVASGARQTCGCRTGQERTIMQAEPGDRYFSWTVLAIDPNDARRLICRCDCGQVKSLSKYDVMGAKTCSCGCLNYLYREPHRRGANDPNKGRRYGSWTILQTVEDNAEFAECQCLCGTVRVVQMRCLRDGTSKSCGCLNRSIARRRKITQELFAQQRFPLNGALLSVDELAVSAELNPQVTAQLLQAGMAPEQLLALAAQDRDLLVAAEV